MTGGGRAPLFYSERTVKNIIHDIVAARARNRAHAVAYDPRGLI
jgi:hypothetical protein